MKVMTRRDALKLGSAVAIHRLLPGTVVNFSTAGTKAQECQPVPWMQRPEGFSAVLPKEVTVYYSNLVDNRSFIVSSEHEEVHTSLQ